MPTLQNICRLALRGWLQPWNAEEIEAFRQLAIMYCAGYGAVRAAGYSQATYQGGYIMLITKEEGQKLVLETSVGPIQIIWS